MVPVLILDYECSPLSLQLVSTLQQEGITAILPRTTPGALALLRTTEHHAAVLLHLGLPSNDNLAFCEAWNDDPQIANRHLLLPFTRKPLQITPPLEDALHAAHAIWLDASQDFSSLVRLLTSLSLQYLTVA